MLKTIAEVLKELDGKPIPPMPPVNFCCKCNSALDGYKTGCRKTKKGLVCDDCYFDILSKHIDKHPIICPPDME